MSEMSEQYIRMRNIFIILPRGLQLYLKTHTQPQTKLRKSQVWHLPLVSGEYEMVSVLAVYPLPWRHWGRTAPGDTLQGVTSERWHPPGGWHPKEKNCGKFTKNSGEM